MRRVLMFALLSSAAWACRAPTPDAPPQFTCSEENRAVELLGPVCASDTAAAEADVFGSNRSRSRRPKKSTHDVLPSASSRWPNTARCSRASVDESEVEGIK